MSRAQTAKSATRADTLRLQYRHFPAYVQALAPLSAIRPVMVIRPDREARPQSQRREKCATQPYTPLRVEEVPQLSRGILQGSRDSARRPNSTPSKHVSIIQTARSIETLPPYDPKYPSAIQEESNLRLFRGSRYETGPRPETLTNPLFKFSGIVSEENKVEKEKESAQKERNTHSVFTASVKFLKKLNFDLDLNFDIAHGCGEVDEGAESSPMGAFYRLQEELEGAVGAKLDDLLVDSLNTYTSRLCEYSKIVRMLLRGLRRKDLENECVMVELLWKLIVKLFDSAIEIHNYTLSDTVEMTKYRIRTEIENRRKEVEEVKAKWGREEEKLKEQIKKLDGVVNYLQGERTKLEQELAERQEELSKIVESSSKDKVVTEMQQIVIKMTQYLNESELEQTRQVSALEGIEAIMSASKRAFDSSPSRVSTEVQTDPIAPVDPPT